MSTNYVAVFTFLQRVLHMHIMNVNGCSLCRFFYVFFHVINPSVALNSSLRLHCFIRCYVKFCDRMTKSLVLTDNKALVNCVGWASEGCKTVCVTCGPLGWPTGHRDPLSDWSNHSQTTSPMLSHTHNMLLVAFPCQIYQDENILV